MADEAFFRREGDTFVPLDPAVGFWGADSMSGRAVVGLLGAEIERRHGGEGFVPARFSVDMHRLARMRPVTVSTEVIRDGGRLRLVEATLSIDGQEYARGQCQMLRPTGTPPGRVWSPAAPWQVPPPAALASEPDPQRGRLSEWRIIAGGLGAHGPRQVWMREYYQIIGGEPLTPFTRIALSADFASPWVHASDRGISYINTDVVIQLHRLPRGEWVGFESILHEATDGIATGNCRLHDEEGSIGVIGVTALNNRMT